MAPYPKSLGSPAVLSASKADTACLSLVSIATLFKEVVPAMIDFWSGVMIKSVTWRVLNDHALRTVPVGLYSSAEIPVV